MDQPTVTRRVIWEIDVEFPADADDRHIAQSVAHAYFQEHIAHGEHDSACSFKVLRHDFQGMWTGHDVDLSK